MQISTRSPHETASKEGHSSVCQPLCPLCSGRLIPLHNLYRCTRCFYTLCVGCEQVEICPTPED